MALQGHQVQECRVWRELCSCPIPVTEWTLAPPRLSSPCCPQGSGNDTQSFGAAALSWESPGKNKNSRFTSAPGSRRGKGKGSAENWTFRPAQRHKPSSREPAGQEAHGPSSYSCAASHTGSSTEALRRRKERRTGILASTALSLRTETQLKASALLSRQPHTRTALRISNPTESIPAFLHGRGRGADPNTPVPKPRLVTGSQGTPLALQPPLGTSTGHCRDHSGLASSSATTAAHIEAGN